MANSKHICLVFLAVTALAAVACRDKENPENTADKIVPTNITVPSEMEIEEGKTITLPLIGRAHVTTSDEVVMRTSANQDIICPIISVDEGNSIEFSLPQGFLPGNYKIYIRRDSLNYYVGTMQLSILQPLKIEPEPGTNVYGIVLCDGKGVPGVLISDGAEFAKTNSDGIYQLKSEKKWKYVFMVIPSGYEVPSQGILPSFHMPLTQDAAIPERKDFELIKTDNDNFTLFVLGDMHLANRNEDIKQFNEFAKTLNTSLATATKPYVLTLGDMTWDLYWYSNKYEFPQYLSTANANYSNVLFFHTMGNHDNDMNSVGDYNKAFQYTRDIAPTYYSYNLGQIHFVVLDNIDYNNVGTGADLRSEYKRNFTAEQMAWLAKDLSYVDSSTPVFISSHAPLSTPSGATGWNNNYLNGADSAGEANLSEFQNAVQGYNVHFLSGHTHNVFNRTFSQNLSEHNCGAVCATWWWTGHLTTGIHVSQDGAPGGYGIWEFNGKNFKHSFRAAGHPADYQFRAYDMNKVKEIIVPSLGGSHKDFLKYSTAVQNYPANTILVNVWDYDPDWKVSISENGKQLTVSRAAAYDPLHVVALSAKRCASASATSTPSFLTSSWSHFFVAQASSANSTVTVTVTDRNGNSYTETMVRPKAFNVNDYKNQ